MTEPTGDADLEFFDDDDDEVAADAVPNEDEEQFVIVESEDDFVDEDDDDDDFEAPERPAEQAGAEDDPDAEQDVGVREPEGETL